jgi:GTP 3',8-cyclase
MPDANPFLCLDETPSANATSIFKSASNITSVLQLHHSLFSSPTPWKSIPTYILPTQTMSHIFSPRYYSTSSKRSTSSEGTPYRSQVKSSRSNPESPSRTPGASTDASITQQGTPYHPHHPKPSHLPHLTASSTAHMIPIHAKPETLRTATAIASVLFSNLSPYNSIIHHSNKKGDVLAVTRLAGIQGAKKCPDLIPLAHPVSITGVSVQVEPIAPAEHEDEKSRSDFGKVVVTATVSTVGRTGVEMEALSAVTVAALTVFDMCKGADRGMQITGARVMRKDGGMSGTWFFGEKAWEGEEEENGQGEKKE